MECKKNEARREMAMAEERIESNDLPGAITFAQRAQVLDPELDGISQMLSMLDVNISAQRRVGGEIDWYGVLGVDPTADQLTIDNRYRDLAQALHPDINPWNGASSALGLVSRARSLLSDRARRATYDRIAGYRPIEGVVVQPEAGESSARAGSASSTRAEVAAPPSAAWMTWQDQEEGPFPLLYIGMRKQPIFVQYGGPCFPENLEVGMSSSGGPSGDAKEAMMDDETLHRLIQSMMMEEEAEMFFERSTTGGAGAVLGNNINLQNAPEEGGGVPANNHQNVPEEENGDAQSVYACW